MQEEETLLQGKMIPDTLLQRTLTAAFLLLLLGWWPVLFGRAVHVYLVAKHRFGVTESVIWLSTSVISSFLLTYNLLLLVRPSCVSIITWMAGWSAVMLWMGVGVAMCLFESWDSLRFA